MPLDDYDFTRAEPTRTAMRADAVHGQPQDIADALRAPDVPDELLARPFEVVTDLDALRGPADGSIQVPDSLTDAALTDAIDIDDPSLCGLLYRQVLLRGSSTVQENVLNQARLIQLWPQLTRDLPAAVTTVWQQRFPELADR